LNKKEVVPKSHALLTLCLPPLTPKVG